MALPCVSQKLKLISWRNINSDRAAFFNHRGMKLISVTASSILHALLLATLTTAAAATNYDHYLLNCGAPSTLGTILQDGRMWYSDNNSTFSANFSSTTTSTPETNTETHLPAARIFTSSFTYSFPVSPGPKFIRLSFYTGSYSTRNLFVSVVDSYLTVQANSGHLLLHNFSAYLSAASDLVVRKEFYVHVSDSRLQLTFSPTPPSLHAFVNGIEVVSVPENLYVDGQNPPEYVVDNSIQVNLGQSASLETAHRVNVGGKEVGPREDSGNMYRTWLNDVPYLISSFKGYVGDDDNLTQIRFTNATPNYSAPAEVYATMRWMGMVPTDVKRTLNVTWGFEVDLGFDYVVRLHWCEIEAGVNSTFAIVFDVYFNDAIAEHAANVLEWVHGDLYTAVHRDYWLHMDSGKGVQSRGMLNLTLRPTTDIPLSYLDILLNGVEIFKVNRSDGSLNAPNPSGPLVTGSIGEAPAKSNSQNIARVIIGVVAGAILLIVLLFCLFIFRRHRKWSKTSAGSSGTTSSKSKGLLSAGKSGTTNRSGGSSSSLPSHLCRHFTLMEIRLATSDFSGSLIVGHGGFGNVYKGTVDTEAGPTIVAIKRLKALSSQGAREFTMEIELLSKLRHVNLVSLIGYCDDAGEMILVYEYMSHGTLRDHLYPHYSDPSTHLSWLGRLEICVGAARGLNYLHTGTDRMVIHRDVKSANILLDERWMAKVSDFGLSKLGPAGADLSHVSTAVKGSFGYVDPEYYRRQQLTEKSDVYSFGVVLFEVLCGRAAVNPNLPKEQVNLRIWARRNQLSGTLDTIVDPTLKGQIAPECLRKFGEVAESCVRDEGAQRPSMADVIGGLQLALRLQMEEETVSSFTGEAAAKDDNTPDEVLDYPMLNSNTSPTTDASVRMIRNSGSGDSTWTSMNNSMSGLFSSTASQDYGGSTPVFSEIFKPEGR